MRTLNVWLEGQLEASSVRLVRGGSNQIEHRAPACYPRWLGKLAWHEQWQDDCSGVGGGAAAHRLDGGGGQVNPRVF